MDKKELEKQIELLVKDDERNQQTIIKQSEEIERLHSIINEARELTKERIEEVKEISYVEMSSKAYIKEQQELLEILDKEK